MIKTLDALNKNAKVWVYQAERPLTEEEQEMAQTAINSFLETWTSHNHQLLAYGEITYHRFVLLFVDETMTTASGCSIDKSVHFIETLGKLLQVDFFDRNTFTYLKADCVKEVNSYDLHDHYYRGVIDDESMFFNTLIKTKEDYLEKWLLPLKSSWHHKFIKK